MKENKHKVTGLTAGLAILLGVLCPLCIIAPLIIAAGFGSILALTAPWFAPALLVLVGISLVGFFLSYRTHKNPFPLILTFVAGGLMYYGRYINYNNTLAYIGGALLIGAIGFDWWIRKKDKECNECKVNYAHQKKH